VSVVEILGNTVGLDIHTNAFGVFISKNVLFLLNEILY